MFSAYFLCLSTCQAVPSVRVLALALWASGILEVAETVRDGVLWAWGVAGRTGSGVPILITLYETGL